MNQLGDNMQNLKQQLQEVLRECERLREENQYLKSILKSNNIFLENNLNKSTNEISNSKLQKINERIQLFKSLFKGRTDVYAVRWESNNGKTGYTPACKFEWQRPICQKPKVKCSNCKYRTLLPLSDDVIYDHLIGKNTIGIYPLLQNETCWFLAVDFDKKSWQHDVQAFIATCKELNIPASIERSRSGNGCHVWIFLEDATSASLVRKLGHVLLSLTLLKRSEVGLDSFDRLFPNQDTLPKGGFGNLIALPLQNGPRKNGNSIFTDENFVPYENQWQYLKHIKRAKIEDIKKVVLAFYQKDESTQTPIKENNVKEIKIPSTIQVIEKNGLFIEKTGLPSWLIQKLIQLATFNNPEFFKAQSKRLSTHGIPRVVPCFDEIDNFLVIPRGCKEDLEKLLNTYNISLKYADCTNKGIEISVDFIGNLRAEQEQAVNNLLQHSIGILSATTGFGKTVVASAILAKRNINTLIIVHRKQLLDQWKERLSMFLNLDKQQIGQIGGGKNSKTGIIDVATIQSLNYKGEIKDVVSQYGQIIVDECHHISAYSFEQVLKKAEAKYILGLTATPTRKDGLQPIMTMQLGKIRYKVNSKSLLENQTMNHILIPRYTNFKSLNKHENKNIQLLYKELVNDFNRNEMIFNDVLKELSKGATPLLLTERVDHAYELASRFNGFVKNIIVLTGKMSKKEKENNLKMLEGLSDDEERLIIATGKYIGEGFDHSKLDTLFLTMPLSWKGTLQQYVGRIHRLHSQKFQVKVFDYVDRKEPMLQVMFEKRMKTYRSMGYKVAKDGSIEHPGSKQIVLF